MEAKTTRSPGYNAQRLRERGLPLPARERGWGPAPVLLGAVTGLLILAVGGAWVYDHSRRDTIASGVRVGGVDIGGLNVSAARQRLQQRLVTPLSSPVTVQVGHRRFRITARGARVGVAVDSLATQALEASRHGWFLGRAFDSLSGRNLNISIPAQATYSVSTVRRFALRVAALTHRSARDATVVPSKSGLRRVGSRNGLEVQTSALIAEIGQALQHPSGGRQVVPPLHIIRPKVTLHSLTSHYPAYIIINRGGFELRFYRHLHLAHTYTIAVGRQGLETPAGLYSIQTKEVNPSWHVPNSSWAGALAGQTIPPGPQDPIKARWMGVNGGAGIHGTDDIGSLGTAGSHGCIRMSIPDVIRLFKQVKVNTPVYIV
jgi:lipoprotein-anchoring transpeptidase ErfK/SrfK